MRQKLLFMQAPTGVGKTISTIFPAVKAVGEELADRIFYPVSYTHLNNVWVGMNSYTEEMKGRTNMLTLDKFEEASEKVKEVTLETKLIYSCLLYTSRCV